VSDEEIPTDPPLTVGQIRAALAGVPDDAQAFAGVVRGGDLAIVAVLPTRMIPWGHDDDPPPYPQVPGVEFVIDEPSRPVPPGSLADRIARRLGLHCSQPRCDEEPGLRHRTEAAIVVGEVAEWLAGHGEAEGFLRGTFDGLAREARRGTT